MDKARPPIPNLYWPFALDWLASFRAISPLLVVTGTGVWETGSQCGPVLLPPFLASDGGRRYREVGHADLRMSGLCYFEH